MMAVPTRTRARRGGMGGARGNSRAGYAACAWCLLFAAVSAYWAAGGTIGANTLGTAITGPALARAPWFVAVLWATVALKVVGGLYALALARGWERPLPRRLLLAGGWLAGAGLSLYGGVPLVVNGLMLGGLLRVPGEVNWPAIRWHFFLWDPCWLLGGVLFALATWHYQRRSRGGD